MNLNNQILIDIPTTVGAYSNYVLKISDQGWYGPRNPKVLHTGRVYVYKEGQYLSLNDILSSYGDNYSWMSWDSVRTFLREREFDTLMDAKLQHQNKVYTRAITDFGVSPILHTDVNFYHPSPFADPNNFNLSADWIDSRTLSAHNLLEMNKIKGEQLVLPKIPRLTEEYTQPNFFIGGLFAVNAGWISTSELDGDPCVSVVVLDENKNIAMMDGSIGNYPIHGISQPIASILISGNILANNTDDGWDNSRSDYKYFAIAPVKYDASDRVIPHTDAEPIILAEYDDCLHDYYLIWCDRSGGYQCQPFNSHTTLKEDITTTSITSILDESRPIIKSISNSYSLKSDWLTFNEYNTYESIFVSPYLYLYDVKMNKLVPVTCSEKQWTEKNLVNTKKPFNLQITLTAARTENILY